MKKMIIVANLSGSETLGRSVDHVLPYLITAYTSPQEAEIFLNSRNPGLDNRRPVDLLAEGKVDEVIDAIKAAVGAFN